MSIFRPVLWEGGGRGGWTLLGRAAGLASLPCGCPPLHAEHLCARGHSWTGGHLMLVRWASVLVTITSFQGKAKSHPKGTLQTQESAVCPHGHDRVSLWLFLSILIFLLKHGLFCLPGTWHHPCSSTSQTHSSKNKQTNTNHSSAI